ncbi:MAG: hypothetical protein AABY22_03475 [Nanoarchaeota archaeon]
MENYCVKHNQFYSNFYSNFCTYCNSQIKNTLKTTTTMNYFYCKECNNSTRGFCYYHDPSFNDKYNNYEKRR